MQKNLFKKMAVFILILSVCLASLYPMNVQAKTTTRINKSKVAILVKGTYSLKVSGLPKNAKKVRWSTSDKKVVSVVKKTGKYNQGCKVKGLRKGTAVITAKVKVGKKYKTYRCKVTVKNATVKNLCKKVCQYYNKKYHTDEFAVFDSEYMRIRSGCSIVVRTTARREANVLFTCVDINLKTGQAIDGLGNKWNIYKE